MRKNPTIVASLVIMAAIAGCKKQQGTTDPVVPPANPTPAPSSVVAAPVAVSLTEANNGQSVAVVNGGTVTVTLTENEAQGLKWVLVTNNDNILSKTDESKKTPTPDKETRRFVFKTEANGTTKLTFAYGPQFHEQEQAQSTVSFVVTVR